MQDAGPNNCPDCHKQAQTFVRKYRELAKDAAGDVDPPAKRARGATTTSFSFHVKLPGAESGLRL